MDYLTLLNEIDEYLKRNDRGFLNPAIYENLCKQVAESCFKSNLYEEGLFYLSESRAASLRLECSYLNNFEMATSSAKNISPNCGLDTEYLCFHSSYAEKKFKGLVDRLKEMPKEWTIIQLSQAFDPHLRWSKRPPNGVADISEIHLVRYSCGDSRKPCHIMLPAPEKSDEGCDILQEIYEITVNNWASMKKLSAAKVMELRVRNNKRLKTLVNQITHSWLREWCCLVLGKFENTGLENSIRNDIDEVISKNSIKLSSYNKTIIYQIAYGSAHLNEDEIQSAVSQIVEENSSQKRLCDEIGNIKNKYSNLIVANRHPVIFILDENLERIPWEMIAILKRHPVCRMPSIHFVHALYKAHEKNIVGGNVIIENPDSTYYLINPDKSLNSTEQRISAFIKARFPKWQGLIGIEPTKDQFCDALTNYELFLYCGHGNGTQFFSASDITALKVKAVPLLFGCSSFQHKNLGGRASFVSLCQKYIFAGSPCMLGTLWPVTSSDIDHICMTFLNHWLPGNPIDLTTIEGYDDYEIPRQSLHEPELLRILKQSRNAGLLYSNCASLIVYGLPVRIK